ncbi:MAG: glycoside hydrolase family 2 protein [Ramlibacter sp.]|nr:glycoside hydrolase family 2 protein [Ramlibacter sp.]
MKPGRGRQPLPGTWAIRECAPGTSAAELDALPGAWLTIDEAMPAAASLRERGVWTLDGPARDFDASDWWYRVGFDAAEWVTDERVVLGFDGLATLATAWLNGQQLLESANMFLAHECDVTDLLRPAGNELLIRFASLSVELARRRPRPRWRTPMLAHQQLRWLRTTLLGRTPGWSPPCAVAGPWRDVWLQRRDALHVTDVHLDVSVRGTDGIVACSIELPGGGAVEAELCVERGGRKHVQRLARGANARCLSGALVVPDADMWWPHTHGEPALYAASLKLNGPGGEAECALGAIGFRTIELDTAGGSFRLKVNGVPVFCRGACWTPLDPVGLRASPGQYHAAVGQARDAGMNMVRVTGTAVYEEDHFYAACDELGVLVWQDFMFASMDYPADDEAFMRSVTAEATQQLSRLHPHPSLAVLCGNSEAGQQAAMWGAPRERWSSPLFEKVLAKVCAAGAPRTPYWPSSAHGGSMPHQADVGTTSYYGVGAYLRPLEDARRADLKFATECLAFANVPSDATIARMPGGLATRVHHPQWKARSPRDLGAGWDFDDVRDHYLRAVFGVDPQKLRYADHGRYLTLSRVVSGEVMAAAFAEWRRPASRCGGAMVLFLRDLWAGAGWGVVDDSGSPKACWHYLRRALQPITVSVTDEGGNGLSVHLVNERGRDTQVQLELKAWQHGETEIASGRLALTLPARGACTVPALDLLDRFVDLTYAYRFGPPPCDTVLVTLKDAHGQAIATAFHFPAGMPALFGTDPGLRATATKIDACTAELTVTTCKTALAVHFDIPGFEAEDEYFHLAPGAQARVVLRSREPAELHGTVHALNAAAAATIRPGEPTSR